MLYAVSLSILVAALIVRNSRIIASSLLVLMFILMAYSYGNADYYTYEMYFELYGSNVTFSTLFLSNGLFKLICAIFSKVGLEYKHLLIFITVVGFFNLLYVSRYYLKNNGVVFSLFFLYPFIIDITQIRNFWAMSFLIVAIHFLINEKKRALAITKFSILNFVAILIHPTFLFYYVLIFVRFLGEMGIKVVVLLSLFLEFILWGRFEYFISLYTSIEKVDKYFNNHIDIITLLFIIFYYLLVNILVKKIYTKNNEDEWIYNIYKISLLMFMTLPLVYFSFEFIRLYRNCFFIFYISLAFWLEKDENLFISKITAHGRKIILKYSAFIYWGMTLLCIFSLYFFILRDYSEYVFTPVFEQCRLFFYIEK